MIPDHNLVLFGMGLGCTIFSIILGVLDYLYPSMTSEDYERIMNEVLSRQE